MTINVTREYDTSPGWRGLGLNGVTVFARILGWNGILANY
jgi:hypothetical protein